MRYFEQNNGAQAEPVEGKDAAKDDKKFDTAWKIRAGLTILVLHGVGLVIAGLISAALNTGSDFWVFVYFYLGWIPLAFIVMPFLKKHLK